MGRRHVGLSAAGARPTPVGHPGRHLRPHPPGPPGRSPSRRARRSTWRGSCSCPRRSRPSSRTRPTSPAEHRVAMVELAMAGNDGVPGQPHGAGAAAAQLHRRYPRIAPRRTARSPVAVCPTRAHPVGRVACGASSTGAARIDCWSCAASRSCLVVATTARRAGWLEERFPGRADRFLMLEGPDLGPSASDIRARVAAGHSIRYLVPDAVARYIETHGLYGSTTTDGGR